MKNMNVNGLKKLISIGHEKSSFTLVSPLILQEIHFLKKKPEMNSVRITGRRVLTGAVKTVQKLPDNARNKETILIDVLKILKAKEFAPRFI